MTVPSPPSLFGPKDVALGHYRRYDKERLWSLFREMPCIIRKIRYWNFIGAPITWFYLKLLKKPVDESIRKEETSFLKQKI